MLKHREIKALIKLLDDNDPEISQHVEDKLLAYGNEAVGFLESAWAQSLDAILQDRIENLVHKIQYNHVMQELRLWSINGAYDLLKGVLIVNKYQYPELNEQAIIQQIEAIKKKIQPHLIHETEPLNRIKLINHIFYKILGFSGNTKNHRDPQNSYLNQVLETKKGNQILLAVIYSVISQKLDIPIYGVNLPQHFVLAYLESDSALNSNVLFYINAFNQGYIFARKDLDFFLKQLGIKPDEHFYKPCSNLDIVKRILRNLINAYNELGQLDKVQELEGLLQILGTQP